MNFLNHFKTATKLALGFGAVSLLLLVLTWMSWQQMTASNQSMDTSLAQAGKRAKARAIRTDIYEINLLIWDLITASSSAKKQADLSAIESQRAGYRKTLEELKASAGHQEDKDLLAKLQEAVDSGRDLNQSVIEMALKADGLDLKAVELFSAGSQKLMDEKIEPAINALVAYREKRIREVDDAAEAAYLQGRWRLAIGALVALGLAAVISVTTSRNIVGPIKECVGFTGLLARGDFSKDVPAELFRRGDEMGDLAKAFHMLAENTRKLLSEVAAGVQTVAATATELSAISSQEATAVKSMSEKACTMAAAAEEASAITVSVAASMEQTSTNLSSVACATEQMSATVGEIANNSEKARAISERATAQAQAISSLMQQLGESAQEIGKFTEIITGISSQTNLLALNATIEAASAGDAGKGFAVVANEIKELARQTDTATENIKTKISGVQTSADRAIAEIGRITGVITEVGQIVASITTSIEEQSVVTKEVAGNIAQATAGVKDANVRIAQTATVSRAMAQDLTGVNAAVAEVRQGVDHVQASTVELSKLAEQLKATSGQFKV